MKRASLFYWLIGIAFVALVMAVAFHFDKPMAAFMTNHQTPGMRYFMLDVSRFGDWPEHFLVGLALLGFAWSRGNKRWARIFLAMLIALSIAGLAGRAIKLTTGRARPSVTSEQMWTGPTLEFEISFVSIRPCRCVGRVLCRSIAGELAHRSSMSCDSRDDWFLAHVSRRALAFRRHLRRGPWNVIRHPGLAFRNPADRKRKSIVESCFRAH